VTWCLVGLVVLGALVSVAVLIALVWYFLVHITRW